MSNEYWLSLGIDDPAGFMVLLLRIVLGSLVIAGSGGATDSLRSPIKAMIGRLPASIAKRFKLSPLEWQALGQFAIIAAIALPLLPNQPMGPWDAVNPRTIGSLILLIAGISLAGHFAMRVLGNRAGLLATSAIGGLVSSTAVTLSFAKRSRQEPQNSAILGAGISLAAAIMAMRVLLEIRVVNNQLLPLLWPPLVCLAVVPLMAAIAITLQVRAEEVSPSPQPDNPLELGAAIFFGLVLAALSILVRATEDWFGDRGVYVLAAISGISDVDALSLSLAEATLRSLSLPAGTLGIFIGTAVNTVVKGIMATAIGGLPLAKWCASILLLSLVLGAIAIGLVLRWG